MFDIYQCFMSIYIQLDNRADYYIIIITGGITHCPAMTMINQTSKNNIRGNHCPHSGDDIDQ